MRKRMKKVSALILAASLLCSAFVLPEVYAAKGVATDTKCFLEVICNVQVDPETLEDIAEKDVLGEVYTNAVTVNLHKVADITVTGKYEAIEAFADLDAALRAVNDKTKASEWQSLAAEAKKLASDATLSATKDIVSYDKFENLDTGMYLVDAQELITPEYRYEFTPYLISLPNNYYYDIADATVEGTAIPETADEWIYNLVGEHAVGLKPQQFDRFGYVVIKKNLTNFDIKDPSDVKNPSAVFVFEVKAEKDEDVVFNDVVAIDFYAAGEDWVKVGPIKAGATVTVTEVYQGANYEKDGEVVLSDNPFVIKAELAWDEWDTLKNEEKQALQRELLSKIEPVDIIATFENKHNDVPNGGTGVVNTFTAGESWGLAQEYQGQSAPQQ